MRVAWWSVVIAISVGSLIRVETAFTGSWSPVFTLATPEGYAFAPEHIATLPDGRVELMGRDQVVEYPFAGAIMPPDTWTAGTYTVTRQAVPYETPLGAVWTADTLIYDSAFCGDGFFDRDGRLVSVGGMRVVLSPTWNGWTGLPYTFRFNPLTNLWTRFAATFVGTGKAGGFNYRWYPTGLRLGDGNHLVIGGMSWAQVESLSGIDLLASELNLSVERFNVASQNYELVSDYNATPPFIYHRDYTAADLLPGNTGDVLMIGASSQAARMTPNGTWILGTKKRGNQTGSALPNVGSVTVQLPIRVNDGEWSYSNGSNLTIGGLAGTSHESSMDVYDPALDRYTRYPMGLKRQYSTASVLLDGRIWTCCGVASDGNPNVRFPQIFDPRTKTLTTVSSGMSGPIRGYHAISATMPNGCVLMASGQPGVEFSGKETPTGQVFCPDYMSNPNRGVLWLTAGPTARLGQTFWVVWVGPTPFGEVNLMELVSNTHNDTNQRYVQLETVGSGLLDSPCPECPVGSVGRWALVKLPTSSHTLPPGMYRIVVLDSNRVPTAPVNNGAGAPNNLVQVLQ